MSHMIFKVVQQDGLWAVEHEGAFTDRSPEKAVAIASANRRARSAMSSGNAVQVRVEGEAGYF